MPTYPAYKLKPYYESLKAWLLESHNEDGTLRSDAVQAEVSAAIASEPTVVDAAAAAVDANPTISGINARVDLLDQLQVNIRSFTGAEADNPLVDNIDPINAAITYAASLGGARVVVPAGTWYVKPSTTHFIEMVSDVHLRLLPGAVLKVRDDTGGFPTLITDATGGDGATYVENVTISGGTIDLSPDTNTGYTMDPADLNVRQQAIKFGYYRNVTVEGVTFHSCGRNTIVLSGSTCYNAIVRDNEIHWQMGPMLSDLEYDNSAVYITVRWGATVTGNHGYTDPAEHARGFVELHGQGLTFSGNHSDGFAYLCYITPNSVTAQEYGTNAIAVTGNTARRAAQAVSIFSFTGKVLSGVKVADNVIGISQIAQNWSFSYGISVIENASVLGSYEDLSITDNVIEFEPDDTRTLDWLGNAMSWDRNYGIGLSQWEGGGGINGAVVRGNLIRNAPSTAIRVGRYGTTTPIANVVVEDNTIIDAGQSSHITSTLRAAVVLAGTLSNVRVVGTTVIDTGTAALNGLYSVYAAGAGLVSATNVQVLGTKHVNQAGVLTLLLDAAKGVGNLRYRGNIDFPSIAAGASAGQTVTIPGATTSDIAYASPGGGLESGLIVAYVAVTAADTVTIRLQNPTAAAIDPVNRTWNVAVTPGAG